MEHISYLNIFWLLIVFLPTFYINHKIGLKITKQTVFALVRMLVQLALMGIYLQFLFDYNNMFLNIAYTLIIVVVASSNAILVAKQSLKKMFIPMFFCILIPDIVVIFIFNKLVLGLQNIFDARYLITVNGMLLGNILSGSVVVLTSYYRGITENIGKVHYSLVLGATNYQATKPYLVGALRASMLPNISNMATIGLVSLPGMMTGQILGGALPMEAILYQAAIIMAIYSARYISNYFSLVAFSHVSINDQNFIKK